MNIKNLTLILLSGLMLSACDKQISKANCSSEVAYKLVSETITDAVEKEASDEKYSDTGRFIFDKAKIRASLDQLQITIESVRTTKDDPNSSKKFCSGVLKVTIPASMLADADQSKELENKPKISEDARELNIGNSINMFTKKDFEFSVQSTDDGKELYVESESTIWVRLLHDITRSALLKPILEIQKAEQAQQNAQEQQEVAQLKQEAKASKLEAEKLSALQEKQEADRLKQEFLDRRVEIQAPTQKSFSPSFDCRKASTGSERLICSSKELSVADVTLAQAYKSAANVSTDKGILKSEQNTWRKNERDACADIECMLAAYQNRLIQLTR